jgi:hypothetical protein
MLSPVPIMIGSAVPSVKAAPQAARPSHDFSEMLHSVTRDSEAASPADDSEPARNSAARPAGKSDPRHDEKKKSNGRASRAASTATATRTPDRAQLALQIAFIAPQPTLPQVLPDFQHASSGTPTDETQTRLDAGDKAREDRSAQSISGKDAAAQQQASPHPSVEAPDAPAPSANVVAFRAKLTLNDNSHDNAQPARQSASAAGSAKADSQEQQKQEIQAVKAAEGSTVHQDHPAPARAQQAIAAFANATAPAATSKTDAGVQVSSPADAQAPQAAAPVQEPADAKAATAAVVREIALRVASSPDQSAQVRIVERAGELYVSVRSGTTEMAQTLRTHLDDLVQSLQHHGIQTEITRPPEVASAAQSAPSQEPGNGREHDAHPGHSQRDRRQQYRNPSPAGFGAELDASMTPNQDPDRRTL